MHPILFQFHGITIYSYGFFTALAVVVSLFLAQKRAKRFGIDRAEAMDALFVLFISGILGARVFYVWQNFEDYTGDLWAVFRIQEGGLVWYGGLFGAIFLGTLYARLRHWPILKLCDFFSPIAALAHGIGRIGCFFNGCCYGLRTDSLLGVHFPGEPYANLPAQLFEALGLFFVSGLLFRFASKPRREGQVFLAYLGLYAILRFLIEFLRGDNTHYLRLTLPQWMSLGLLSAAALLFYLTKKKK